MHSGTCSKLNSGTHSSKNVGHVADDKKTEVAFRRDRVCSGRCNPDSASSTAHSWNYYRYHDDGKRGIILSDLGIFWIYTAHGGTGKFKGRTADCVRAENHARTAKQPDG